MSKQVFTFKIGKNDFKNLALQRDKANGEISFSIEAIKSVCEDNGFDPAHILFDEDNFRTFILAWYQAHLSEGGERDPVVDEILIDAVVTTYGPGYINKPGNA